MKKFHNVQVMETDDKYLYLSVDNQIYRVRWRECSPKLAKATLQERNTIEISPSGYGLHWREIDEDLAIDPLLKIAERVANVPAHA